MALELVLGPGREKSVLRRHPWLFSGAVAARSGDPSDGLARVLDASHRPLGWGLASPDASLVARMVVWGDAPRPDAALFEGRIRAAVARRAPLLDAATTGCRLVHAEGDDLPGVVADLYGDVLVLQATTFGAERTRPLWLPPLLEASGARTCVQKNNLPGRREEGLGLADEVLAGELPADPVPFLEHGLTFVSDVREGQKTGFYLDQRENRHLVRRLAAGRSVLECYAYSGAFGTSALAGGARLVHAVDSSARAMDLVRLTRTRNGLLAPDDHLFRADVPQELRRRVDAGESWDLVVLDPPPFARKRFDVDRATRAYKDINRLAFRLLAPGGLLVTCSCSGLVDADLFQKVVFSASLDAGVPARLLERRGAGWDHPVSLDCPEGEYLKVLVLQRG